jgi:hypothetical protein
VYEALSFDVMLDQQAKPWIIKVNDLPSFEAPATILVYEALSY